MSAQPPSESIILSRVLLIPSPLPTVVPLETFGELFPPYHRSTPQISLLYRSLRHQRGLDLDLIRDNIAAEVARGKDQMKELARIRAADAANAGSESTMGGSVDAGSGLFDDTSYIHRNGGKSPGAAMILGKEAGRRKIQTAANVVSALEAAVRDLEAEITEINDEVEAREQRIEDIVDGLSDLKYGKVKQEDGKDALDILRELDRELDRTLKTMS